MMFLYITNFLNCCSQILSCIWSTASEYDFVFHNLETRISSYITFQYFQIWRSGGTAVYGLAA